MIREAIHRMIELALQVPQSPWHERRHYLRSDDDIEGPSEAPGMCVVVVMLIGIAMLVAWACI